MKQLFMKFGYALMHNLFGQMHRPGYRLPKMNLMFNKYTPGDFHPRSGIPIGSSMQKKLDVAEGCKGSGPQQVHISLVQYRNI